MIYWTIDHSYVICRTIDWTLRITPLFLAKESPYFPRANPRRKKRKTICLESREVANVGSRDSAHRSKVSASMNVRPNDVVDSMQKRQSRGSLSNKVQSVTAPD